MKKVTILAAVLLSVALKLSAQTTILAKEASNHIGEKVTVRDSVYDQDLKAFHVTLFLGGVRSEPVLAVSIRFARKYRETIPENYFRFKGKMIWVTGVVTSQKGRYYIKVDDPAQIK